MCMGIEVLLDCIKEYAPYEKNRIIKAYEYASEIHKGVKRKSGEDYIIHPLWVGYILATMKADADTICAGILHDVMEDGNITKEELTMEFNSSVAELVDGVTKIKKIVFDNDEKKTDDANLYKLMVSIIRDIRVMIIRLADRLHNMRTEQFQPPEKQIEHSDETREIHIPFAKMIGAYTIMLELEDYCFFYKQPKEYAMMEALIEEVKKEYLSKKEEIVVMTAKELNRRGIPYTIKTKIKTPYELYRKYKAHDGDIKAIHDLYAIKVLMAKESYCYAFNDYIKSVYPITCGKSKDYIANPKANMYQGLHTSIMTEDGYNFQFQLKTEQMYIINSYGITAYWRELRKRGIVDAAHEMQELAKQYPFFSVLESLTNLNIPNEEFHEKLKESVLYKK